MIELHKDYVGLTPADWLTFRPLLDKEADHIALLGHLRDLVNKSLKGAQFALSVDDVTKAVQNGAIWKRLRSPGAAATPIEATAMQTADKVNAHIAYGFYGAAANGLAAATTLHHSVGGKVANDSSSNTASILDKADVDYHNAMSFSMLMYTTYDNGVCRRDWDIGGETRDMTFTMVGDAISAAKRGKFPPKPKKRYSIGRSLLKLLKLDRFVPERPKRGTPQDAPLPPRAND